VVVSAGDVMIEPYVPSHGNPDYADVSISLIGEAFRDFKAISGRQIAFAVNGSAVCH
jgi:hypothetical protein